MLTGFIFLVLIVSTLAGFISLSRRSDQQRTLLDAFHQKVNALQLKVSRLEILPKRIVALDPEQKKLVYVCYSEAVQSRVVHLPDVINCAYRKVYSMKGGNQKLKLKEILLELDLNDGTSLTIPFFRFPADLRQQREDRERKAKQWEGLIGSLALPATSNAL